MNKLVKSALFAKSNIKKKIKLFNLNAHIIFIKTVFQNGLKNITVVLVVENQYEINFHCFKY